MKIPYTSPNLSQPPHYAHAVMVKGSSLIYTAGGVPLNEKGELIGKGDVLAQTQKVIENLTKVLQECSVHEGAESGTAKNEVVKITVYVVSNDPATLASVWNEVVRLDLANEETAATLLGVNALGYVDQLVEIEVVAAVSV